MSKISDETDKFLSSYSYLFWGPLFIGTQRICHWRIKMLKMFSSLIELVGTARRAASEKLHGSPAFMLYTAFICVALRLRLLRSLLKQAVVRGTTNPAPCCE